MTIEFKVINAAESVQQEDDPINDYLQQHNEALQLMKDGDFDAAWDIYSELSKLSVYKERLEEIPQINHSLKHFLQYSVAKNLGVLCEKRGDYLKALDYHSKALGLDPTDCMYWLHIANHTSVELGDSGLRLQALEFALDNSFSAPKIRKSVLTMIAEIYFKDRNYKEAYSYIQEALKYPLEPMDPVIEMKQDILKNHLETKSVSINTLNPSFIDQKDIFNYRFNIFSKIETKIEFNQGEFEQVQNALTVQPKESILLVNIESGSFKDVGNALMIKYEELYLDKPSFVNFYSKVQFQIKKKLSTEPIVIDDESSESEKDQTEEKRFSQRVKDLQSSMTISRSTSLNSADETEYYINFFTETGAMLTEDEMAEMGLDITQMASSWKQLLVEFMENKKSVKRKEKRFAQLNSSILEKQNFRIENFDSVNVLANLEMNSGFEDCLFKLLLLTLNLDQATINDEIEQFIVLLVRRLERLGHGVDRIKQLKENQLELVLKIVKALVGNIQDADFKDKDELYHNESNPTFKTSPFHVFNKYTILLDDLVGKMDSIDLSLNNQLQLLNANILEASGFAIDAFEKYSELLAAVPSLSLKLERMSGDVFIEKIMSNYSVKKYDFVVESTRDNFLWPTSKERSAESQVLLNCSFKRKWQLLEALLDSLEQINQPLLEARVMQLNVLMNEIKVSDSDWSTHDKIDLLVPCLEKLVKSLNGDLGKLENFNASVSSFKNLLQEFKANIATLVVDGCCTLSFLDELKSKKSSGKQEKLKSFCYYSIFLLAVTGLKQVSDPFDRVEVVACIHEFVGKIQCCVMENGSLLEFLLQDLLEISKDDQVADNAWKQVYQIYHCKYGVSVQLKNDVQDHQTKPQKLNREAADVILHHLTASLSETSKVIKGPTIQSFKETLDKLADCYNVDEITNDPMVKTNKLKIDAYLNQPLVVSKISSKKLQLLPRKVLERRLPDHGAFEIFKNDYVLSWLQHQNFERQPNTSSNSPYLNFAVKDALNVLYVDPCGSNFYALAKCYALTAYELMNWTAIELICEQQKIYKWMKSAFWCFMQAIQDLDSMSMRQKAEMYSEFGELLLCLISDPCSEHLGHQVNSSFKKQEKVIKRALNAESKFVSAKQLSLVEKNEILQLAYHCYHQAIKFTKTWMNYKNMAKVAIKLNKKIDLIVHLVEKAIQLVPSVEDDPYPYIDVMYMITSFLSKKLETHQLPIAQIVAITAHLYECEPPQCTAAQFLIERLAYLAKLDKSNSVHQLIYRSAKLLYSSGKRMEALEQVSKLFQLKSTKSYLNFWKTEYQRHGKYFCSIEKYIQFYALVLKDCNQVEQLKVLERRIKRSNNGELIHETEVWTSVVHCYLYVLQQQSTGNEVDLKFVSPQVLDNIDIQDPKAIDLLTRLCELAKNVTESKQLTDACHKLIAKVFFCAIKVPISTVPVAEPISLVEMTRKISTSLKNNLLS